MISTIAAFTPILLQLPPSGDTEAVSKPIVMMMLMVILSLAPFIMMMTTSFVKISVVFSMIRTALGTQQIPPNQIVTGLALILTIYIMIPVGQDVFKNIDQVIHSEDTNQPILSMASVETLKKAVELGKEPVRQFLIKHASLKDRELFYNLAMQLQGKNASIGKDDFLLIVPAFVISELTQAFQIGFILFLPFLVIDMVVSNILLSMGMFMVSPVTVALPFKLLLFVLVDGWSMITKGLVLGYIK